MAQTLGWSMAEARRALRSWVARICSVVRLPRLRSLRTTGRWRRVSFARYTTPLPPAPILRTNSYCLISRRFMLHYCKYEGVDDEETRRLKFMPQPSYEIAKAAAGRARE